MSSFLFVFLNHIQIILHSIKTVNFITMYHLINFSTLFSFKSWLKTLWNYTMKILSRFSVIISIECLFIFLFFFAEKRNWLCICKSNVVTRRGRKINGNWTECAYNNLPVAWSVSQEMCARMRFATRQSVDVFTIIHSNQTVIRTRQNTFPPFFLFSLLSYLSLCVFSLHVCVQAMRNENGNENKSIYAMRYFF